MHLSTLAKLALAATCITNTAATPIDSAPDLDVIEARDASEIALLLLEKRNNCNCNFHDGGCPPGSQCNYAEGGGLCKYVYGMSTFPGHYFVCCVANQSLFLISSYSRLRKRAQARVQRLLHQAYLDCRALGRAGVLGRCIVKSGGLKYESIIAPLIVHSHKSIISFAVPSLLLIFASPLLDEN